MIHRLTSGHFHFIKNMIVGAADQDPGLLHPNLFYQLKIFFVGANPGSHFWKLVVSLHTFIDSIAIFFTVKEKFTLPDNAILPSKAMQIIKNCHNLFSRVRCAGLLPIAERRVRNPDLLRHIMRHNAVVKRNLWYLIIREKIAENIWFLHIDQLINMLL